MVLFFRFCMTCLKVKDKALYFPDGGWDCSECTAQNIEVVEVEMQCSAQSVKDDDLEVEASVAMAVEKEEATINVLNTPRQEERMAIPTAANGRPFQQNVEAVEVEMQCSAQSVKDDDLEAEAAVAMAIEREEAAINLFNTPRQGRMAVPNGRPFQTEYRVTVHHHPLYLVNFAQNTDVWRCDGRSLEGGCKLGCIDVVPSCDWNHYICTHCYFHLCEGCKNAYQAEFKVTVHPHLLCINHENDDWACDGMYLEGGCKQGCTDFGQTDGWKHFRCKPCNYDLCQGCKDAYLDTTTVAHDAAAAVRHILEDGSDWYFNHHHDLNKQSLLIPWIVQMAADAPTKKAAKEELRRLLAIRWFTRNIDCTVYGLLLLNLKRRLGELGACLLHLPADALGLDLTFNLPSLMAPEACTPGYRATQLGVLKDILSADAEGMDWDFDDPVAMHERVAIHVLLLLAIAVQSSFHAKVKQIGKELFGDDFDGFHPAPMKSYARMCGKLMSREDHRHETIRPRPALNVDIVRCLMAVPSTKDIPIFLNRLVEEFGGFVKVKNKYEYSAEQLESEYNLRLILCTVMHSLGQTMKEVADDPNVQQQWAQYAAQPAYLDNEPKCRRNLHVIQALQRLRCCCAAHVPVAMLCEVQLVTQATAGARQRMHELFRVCRAPNAEVLFKDYGRVSQPEPKDLRAAVALGELDLVEQLWVSEAVDATDVLGHSVLHFAANYGHSDVAKFLLCQKSALDQTDKWGRTPLFIAATAGHIEVVRVLLEHGAAKDKPIENGATALLMAAGNGHLDVVQCLLESGADKDKENENGNTPLVVAAMNGHADVVHCLLQHGADKDKETKDGSTALLAASQNGHLSVVQCLLHSGAGIDKTAEDGATPLLMAAELGHVDVVRCLLQSGADKDQAAKKGNTPLLMAAKQGYLNIVQCLLQNGANVDKAMENGATPLLMAAENGHSEVVLCLLQSGAVKDKEMKDSSTPLLMAAQKGHLAVVQCLLESGADKDKAMKDGATPLCLAALHGHLSVVQCLLQSGADKDAQAEDGATPLLMAAVNGRLDVVRCLVQSGADKDKAMENGATPLLMAAQKGHLAVVQCLLESGADKDKAMEGGATPLLMASQNGHVGVVQCLLQSGASIDKAAENGATPLLMASEFGHFHVVQCLLQSGADQDQAAKNGVTPLLMAVTQRHLNIVQCLLQSGADKDKPATNGATPLLMAAVNGHLAMVQCLMQSGADKERAALNGATPLLMAAALGHSDVVQCLQSYPL